MEFPDTMTLGEARAALRELVAEGHHCPCCSQMARIYRRRITRPMALCLIECWRKGDTTEYIYIADLSSHSPDFTKLVYWGLISEQRTARPDGGRAGYWRVTDKGEDYLLDRIAVPKYAEVYDARCLRLDDSEWATIHEALGKGFDLTELLGETVSEDGQVAFSL